MKKMYKKNLFGLLLVAVCLMVKTHGYAQNNLSTSTLRTISSEYGVSNIRPEMNDNGRAISDRGWYYYDNGTYADAIGLTNGGSFYWGVMFPAGSYTGNVVTKVKMYDYTAHTGNIMIYRGGTNAPGTLVYSQAYTCTGCGDFVEWTLNAPVPVNSNQNLWIVMFNNDGQYVAPVCNDTGNPNGRWISTDGSSWNDLASSNLNFTWMLRAYLETVSSYSWNFDNGMQGWTTIDADGDGYTWTSSQTPGAYHYSNTNLQGGGHNSSAHYVLSGSWINQPGQALFPDNYFVSPQVSFSNSSTFSFWACAQDANYPSEHFGVAVSTTGNTNANEFTTIQEWTMTAKSIGSQTVATRSGGRVQGNWYQYTVNLNSYAGQTGYVAIRHFNCTDMFVLNVDDVTFTNGSVTYYTITATANPTSGGTVTGSGQYISGSTCTLHAVPNSGYTFVKWTKNGTQVSTNPNYSFTVTGNASYVAHFQQNVTYYTITATASPSNGGTVSGGGSYASGSTCTLHAVPNSGYTFVKWTKNGTQVSTNPDYSFAVTGNATYVANFQQNVTYYTITATASPTNGGTVTGSGSYASGTTCTLHAVANSGYTFVKWTKNGTQVSTNPDYSFTVTGNATYVANFQQNVTYYTITATASPTNGGTVTGGGSYASGTTCTLHATPNSGYTFVKWTKNGTQVSTNPDYSFIVTSNATYVANFQQSTNNYTVNVLANPTYGGDVTGGGIYQQGQQCTVTATANEGYTFTNWTEDGVVASTNPNYAFTVTGNRILVANFQIQSYTITVTIDPADGGTVIGEGTYNYGESCTLVATPNNGYTFVGWKKNGALVSTNPVLSFIVTEDSVSYVACFAQSVNSFTITASADPAEGGSVTGGGNYNQGEECTLTASPNNDYTFVNWTTNGSVVSEEQSFSFTVSENASYVAHFMHSVSGYTISVNSNLTDGGTVTGAGTYAPGLICILTATANEGYKFVNWTENGVIQWMADQYEFVVDRDRTIVANFEALPTFTISAMAGPNGSITPQGDVVVIKGSDQTFTMTPDSGGCIVKVLIDGIDIGVIESYTFTNVNHDHTIYVSFSGMDVEEAWIPGVNVYPNPAKDIVYVEGEGIETVVMYDMVGNCLRSIDYTISRELHVSDLPQGTYVLKLTTQDGRIGYQKLVLN